MASVTRHHVIIGRFAAFRAAEPKLWSARSHRVQGELCGIEFHVLGFVVYLPMGWRRERAST